MKKVLKMAIFSASLFSLFPTQEVMGQEAQELPEEFAPGNEFNQKIADMSGRIDRLSNNLNVEVLQLQDQIAKIFSSQQESEAVAQSLPEIQSGLAEIQQAQTEIATVQAAINNFEDTKSDLIGSVEAAKSAASTAERTAVNTRNIIAAIGITVSALGTIVGLMFSSRFSDLKAETVVAKELLSRIEGERLSKSEILSAISEAIKSQQEEKPVSNGQAES